MNIRERFKRIIIWTVIVVTLFIAYVIFILFGPLKMECMSYKITGLSCSGCGVTRMGLALMHGKFYQAFRYNAFLFLSLPVLLLSYLFGAYRYIKYESPNKWITKALFIYAILLFAFGIIRNIPGFQWLLPTTI